MTKKKQFQIPLALISLKADAVNYQPYMPLFGPVYGGEVAVEFTVSLDDDDYRNEGGAITLSPAGFVELVRAVNTQVGAEMVRLDMDMDGLKLQIQKGRA